MFVTFFVVFVTLSFVIHYLKVKRYPPGPFSVPFLGTVDLITQGNNANRLVNKDYHKYGDMYSLYFGPTFVFVVINDLQLAKQLFSKDDFSGIP